MVARRKDEPMNTTKNETNVERASDTELVITRAFNAVPRIVFDAWTKPELVKRWWAPKSRGAEMVSVDADVRVGGSYRYVFNARGSGNMAFSGKYLEVVAPSRLVHTEGFEPAASGVEGEPSTVTVTFEARGDKTFVTSRSKFTSKDVLDMVLATGMEGGMRETMDQLDELVGGIHA
jgi:uncharacterized protein YndB with AHSA1/START domain